MPLEPPDKQHWQAAVGYVELGMYVDPEQVRILGKLQKKAKETQDRVDEILGAENDEDERINKLVDAFVEQLVKNPPERAIPAT